MENITYCTECKNKMTQGYSIHDGLEHYCSNRCLHKNINKEDYLYMYEQGFAFWVMFKDLEMR